jgi:hypothetical protein
VDTVRLTYPHSYTADGDSLRFTVMGASPTTVAGFTSDQIRVMDITDPGNVIALHGVVTAQGGGCSVMVGAQNVGTRTLLAFTSAKTRQPVSLAANQPSSWNRAQAGADMVILSHGDFVSSVAPLQELRQS